MPIQARTVRSTADYGALDDAALVAAVLDGHRDAFRQVMQRCNQRLFRVARAVIRNDTEAEDIVQEAYLRAYGKLDTFRGDSTLLTWMTSIVLNEARGRLRKRKPMVGLEQIDIAAQSASILPFPSRAGQDDPVALAARAQIRQLLEDAIDGLPAIFRVVYVMRELEQCSVQDTARQLAIPAATVKTRLFRARRLLRMALKGPLSAGFADAFEFMGPRCARMTEQVMARLPLASPPAA